MVHLVARLICMLLELASNTWILLQLMLLESARDKIVVWVGMQHTHHCNPNIKQGREFGGDGGTQVVAPVAEHGLHDLKLCKNTV